jgi:hypothetical protein
MLVLVVATVAAAQDEQTKRGNLDSDAAFERVRVVDERPSAPSSEIPRYRVRIADTCPEGDVDVPVSRLGTSVRLRLAAADTRRGREVFFDNEGSGRGGPLEVRLVAWRAAATPCRVPRTLFRYPPPGGAKDPRGGDFRAAWSAKLGDYAPRAAGLEIRLDEWYTDENDSIAEPTVLRRTHYRYNAKRDRHTRYRRVVKYGQQY